ncbi:MAG: hypothetical protein Q7J82_06980 [Coriobacteriia bacterium]|nr:hypothetical protein [Coriobacteriia bacterium]
MREDSGTLRSTGFLLVIIGTLGLLANEFVLDWGTAATLGFAGFNIIGLLDLWFSFSGQRS